MTDDELIDDFVLVFRGRADVYGNAKGYCEHSALTRAVFEKHLRSNNPGDHIGVYCMVGERCSWGCIDIDGKDFPMTCPTCFGTGADILDELDEDHAFFKAVDCPAGCYEGSIDGVRTAVVHDWAAMYELARNLGVVLGHAPGGPVATHIERTKNGYHVWVFPEQPLVPARAMRRALMAACKAIGYNPKEVNPKAEGPRPGTKGYGNFVRLPYGGYLGDSWEPKARYMIDDEHEPLSLHAFLQDGWLQRTPLEHLEACAALWTERVFADHEVDVDAGLEAEPLLPLLDGLSFTIWKDGPLPGKDRSSTLHQLAYLLRERGLTATQAYAVLKAADARWGKFQDRPGELVRMVERAYS